MPNFQYLVLLSEPVGEHLLDCLDILGPDPRLFVLVPECPPSADDELLLTVEHALGDFRDDQTIVSESKLTSALATLRDAGFIAHGMVGPCDLVECLDWAQDHNWPFDGIIVSTAENSRPGVRWLSKMLHRDDLAALERRAEAPIVATIVDDVPISI
jgi:hypothetical protein